MQKTISPDSFRTLQVMTGPLQLTFVTSAVDISTLPESPAEVAVVGR